MNGAITEAVTIIAEAGVNHNGSPERAHGLIEAAAAAGANIVKFQTFRADRMISSQAAKARYQVASTGGAESQLEMVRRLELDAPTHRELIRHAAARGIEFLSTPFDLASVDLLCELGLQRLKVPSGEITNGPLLLRLARTGLRLIVSTGMATLEEVESALELLAFGFIADADAVPDAAKMSRAFTSRSGQELLCRRVTLLHCTTEYPAPADSVNLRAMHSLAQAFGLPVGYSDHTRGIAIATAATALGASVIEKHFTLDRALPGPDHAASLEPGELRAMVEAIREVEAALGDGIKAPRPCEIENAKVIRKSLVAARDITGQESLNGDNLTAMRPGTGLSPMRYWEHLGRTAGRGYQAGELIE